MSAPFLGEFTPGKTVRRRFNSHTAAGTPITLAGSPAISVYKGSTTESTTGVTLTVDYDGRTGLHDVVIDTSADGTFYAAGNDFDIVITAGTVDSISVVGTVVGTFSLSNRAGLRPTTADRTLDVSSGGEAGLDWANVGAPTTTLALTGTTISSSQVAASVTGAVGSVTGSVGSVTGAVGSVTGAVGSVTGNVGGNVTGSVGSVTGAVGSVTGNVGGNVTGSVGSVASGGITSASFAAGAINAAAIATDAIGAAELAADAIAEIQAGLSTLDAAGVRAAVGLANANLDAQLTAIDDFLDTEIAAIKAKTDGLPSDPADASDIAASFATVNATLATIATYIDTEVGAIKAKTDNLPSDPADASDIAASFATVNGTLATIAGYIDTEVAAIKAKTDVMPSAADIDTTLSASHGAGTWGGGAGLDAAGVRAALGMATANLDAQLTVIDDYLDTEIAAIKAKTDALPADPADASDIAAAIAALPSAAAVASQVDTTLSVAHGSGLWGLGTDPVVLPLGTVVASPAPTLTTFSATGAGLVLGSSGYDNYRVMFQSGAGNSDSAVIASHAVVGSRHDFTLSTALQAVPVAGAKFVVYP